MLDFKVAHEVMLLLCLYYNLFLLFMRTFRFSNLVMDCDKYNLSKLHEDHGFNVLVGSFLRKKVNYGQGLL